MTKNIPDGKFVSTLCNKTYNMFRKCFIAMNSSSYLHKNVIRNQYCLDKCLVGIPEVFGNFTQTRSVFLDFSEFCQKKTEYFIFVMFLLNLLALFSGFPKFPRFPKVGNFVLLHETFFSVEVIWTLWLSRFPKSKSAPGFLQWSVSVEIWSSKKTTFYTFWKFFKIT